MKEIIAYEMQFKGDEIHFTDIELIPFQDKYYLEYALIYNECFYDMRKALDVQPYHFYSDYDQMKDKKKDIFLLLQER